MKFFSKFVFGTAFVGSIMFAVLGSSCVITGDKIFFLWYGSAVMLSMLWVSELVDAVKAALKLNTMKQ